MSYINLLTICVSVILGFCGVASIFVAGWVKASHIAELKALTEGYYKELRVEINSIWEKLSKVEVLSSKIESVEKGVDEIKEMLRAR